MREIKFRAFDFVKNEMIGADSLAFEEYAPISELLTDNDLMYYMQCTGLKDKNEENKTEVYEDDILQCIKGLNYHVVFDKGRFMAKHPYDGRLLNLYKVLNERMGIVVGNIYQNKDLLNG